MNGQYALFSISLSQSIYKYIKTKILFNKNYICKDISNSSIFQYSQPFSLCWLKTGVVKLVLGLSYTLEPWGSFFQNSTSELFTGIFNQNRWMWTQITVFLQLPS